MPRLSRAAVACAAAGAALFAAASPLHACGGFFCGGVPVDQSGEQIVFSVQKNHITAQILINYQGDAKDFAWLLPVMSKPKLSLGSAQVFRIVQQRTQPQFRIDWKSPQGGSAGASRKARRTRRRLRPGGRQA